MTTIIITGGTVDTDFASSFIANTTYDCLLAADSGLNAVSRMGLRPDIIIGDFDSVEGDILEGYLSDDGIEIVRFNPIKDYTDTDLAIKTALSKGADCIYILGASGSRIDHMLGSIHCLKSALDAGASCYIVDEHNRIHLLGGDGAGPYSETLHKGSQWGSYVSLIPLTSSVTGVELTGFAYEMTGGTFNIGESLGISNEIVADAATVTIGQGILIVAESRD